MISLFDVRVRYIFLKKRYIFFKIKNHGRKLFFPILKKIALKIFFSNNNTKNNWSRIQQIMKLQLKIEDRFFKSSILFELKFLGIRAFTVYGVFGNITYNNTTIISVGNLNPWAGQQRGLFLGTVVILAKTIWKIQVQPWNDPWNST